MCDDISEGTYQLNELLLQDHARELREEAARARTRELERDLDARVWVTRDGTRIPLREMPTGHIANCLAYLSKRAFHPPLGERWAAVFREELARRDHEREVAERLREELCRPSPFRTFAPLDETPF